MNLYTNFLKSLVVEGWKKKMTQAQVFKKKNLLNAHKLALEKLLQMKEQQKRDLEVVSYYLAWKFSKAVSK